MRDWLDRWIGRRVSSNPLPNEIWNVRDSRRAIAAAAKALRSLEASTQNLKQARAEQSRARECAIQDYLEAVREVQALEGDVHVARQQGDATAVAAAIARIRHLDRCLPSLKQTVARADAQALDLSQTLEQQQRKLRVCRQQLQHLHNQHAFNQADAARLHMQTTSTAARDTFASARETLERYQDRLQAMETLTRDSEDALFQQLEQLDRDD